MMCQPYRHEHVLDTLLVDYRHWQIAYRLAGVALDRTPARRFTQNALSPLGSMLVVPRSDVRVVIIAGCLAEGNHLRRIGEPLSPLSAARSERVDFCLSGCHPHPLAVVFSHAHGCSSAWRSSVPKIANRVPATFP